MWLKVLVGVGFLLLAVGLGVGAVLLGGALFASTRDGINKAHGSISDYLPCPWEASLSRRVMVENETQTVLVSATNTYPEACQMTVTLRAPGFDLSPSKEQQSLTLPAGLQGSRGWIVTPRKTGVYDVVVADELTTRTLGLTVTNVFGLNAFQSQLLAGLGSFLGPMLTAPWWFDKWQQRNKQKQPVRKEPAEAAPASPPPPASTAPQEKA